MIEDSSGNRMKFSPVEAERAQGLPDNYTLGVSENQRFKMLGNCWTIPVIEYLLSDMGFDR
jgi:site-specific DNA-cytosine methylase